MKSIPRSGISLAKQDEAAIRKELKLNKNTASEETAIRKELKLKKRNSQNFNLLSFINIKLKKQSGETVFVRNLRSVWGVPKGSSAHYFSIAENSE